MNEKIRFIKNLFNIIFPYDTNFRIKFFDYLENQPNEKGEENLEIIGSLLQLLQNQKSHEHKMIISTVLQSLREKGILINISQD